MKQSILLILIIYVGLTCAAEQGNTDFVSYLCAIPNIRPAYNDNYPLIAAAEGGHLDTVRFLASLPLSDKVDMGARNQYPLYVAAAYGHLEVVRFSIIPSC